MRLEQHLVLNRFMHGLFGAESLEELKGALYGLQEGAGADGLSHFYGSLSDRAGIDGGISAKLADYDRRVMDYERRLGRLRGGLRLRYFQYLALLYTEAYLDLLTADRAGFLSRLNAFLTQKQAEEPHLALLEPFTPDDLRRLAFFMATGSGKTLIMHANIWQLLYYLNHGRHPEALVQRADGRCAFDNILLITPGEGLSAQHLEELRLSGIHASHISEGGNHGALLGPTVTVVEIHKLVETASGEGVSIPLESLGGANLVLVDEGHKGTGSEAQTWKDRQKRLSAHGFLLEYSATFAQAIGAASKRASERLLAEYGKAILFDYSYRHFHGDGYGKAFRVLNLQRGEADSAHELLVGGLLTFYQQLHLFDVNREAYRPYNLEKPLWVFIGSSVSASAVYTRRGRKQSDVATVVAFLRRFLEDEHWAVETIGRLRAGTGGFRHAESGEDLFADAFPFLAGGTDAELYAEICSRVFHGRGSLEVCELKSAEGEFGLRVTSPMLDAGQPYFGVINIGDSAAFRKHLREHVGLETTSDQFTSSLFDDISGAGSEIFLLVGAKRFIEGWNSWRVATMGLLNIGRGEGSQVIQLFGRGVRLKGKGMSLKRSAFLRAPGLQHPAGLGRLETLQIFGWNADYLEQFRQMMEREGLVAERTLEVQHKAPWPQLPIPTVRQGFSALQETWRLETESVSVVLDLRPRWGAYDGATLVGGELHGRTIDWMASLPLIDQNALYLSLLEYKQTRGYGNLFVDRSVLPAILERCEVTLPVHDVQVPERVQSAAEAAARTYLDRFYAHRERTAESAHLVPGVLAETHENIIGSYALRISDTAVLKEIDQLLETGAAMRAGGGPLPRLYIDFHLYNPVLKHPGKNTDTGISISPPGLNEQEAMFVEGLVQYWSTCGSQPPYDGVEVYLLRNLPRVGVGFFVNSGFYPDFVVWAKNRDSGHVRVVFVEPHSLVFWGLEGARDKIEALHTLSCLGDAADFHERGISLDGYILTTHKDLSQRMGKSWAILATEYKVLPQGSECYPRLLLGNVSAEDV